MEQISLAYGAQRLNVRLAGAGSITILEERALTPIQDLPAAFSQAVENPIASPPLRQVIDGRDCVTIVLSDITRFWMRQDKICALLTAYLHDVIGVPYDNMAILIALGTHRAQTEDELTTLVTPGVFARVRVYNHDCMADDLVEVGVTSRGTVVKVHPLAVGRKVILVGGTVHHLMAGFGGGRKNILPGICAKSTINQNHLHSLSQTAPCSNPFIGTGKRAGNPIYEDMDEAAALVAPVFGINIVASGGAHCRLFCGHWRLAWEESCKVVQEAMGVTIPHLADVVVASAGGFPRDINLYQSIKTLLNASLAVKDGGSIYFLAECREGGGTPDFFGWLEPLRRGTLDAELRANYSIGGYIFYAACEIMARANVVMLTQLPPSLMADMRIRAYAEVADFQANLDVCGKSVYVMPRGGNTVPCLHGALG
ncbi:MAG: nickel-dependent lactate racemase [Christensenellaceae bacterium]|jgi:nickel-dependent lactate racemase|nr:nickel-dependent lactate racemase [Christensenellaceae bacterium]